KQGVAAIVLLLAIAVSLSRWLPSSSGISMWLTRSLPDPQGNRAEQPVLSPAERAALATGVEQTWDEQGLSWTLPQDWTGSEQRRRSFTAGERNVPLFANVTRFSDDFDPGGIVGIGLANLKEKERHQEVEDVRVVELAGVPGVLYREVRP